MHIKIDLANFLTIGLIAFLSVYLVDAGMNAMGMKKYTATGA